MIVGTGIDIAEPDRIQRAAERFGRRFLERIYTPKEIAYCERKANQWERFAARFAAKEAAFKALGTGWQRGVKWIEVEVANEPSGKPTLNLTGACRTFADKLEVARIALSMTHTKKFVIAQVIFEK